MHVCFCSCNNGARLLLKGYMAGACGRPAGTRAYRTRERGAEFEPWSSSAKRINKRRLDARARIYSPFPLAERRATEASLRNDTCLFYAKMNLRVPRPFVGRGEPRIPACAQLEESLAAVTAA